MLNERNVSRTITYAYDQDTKIRVVIDPDGTRLIVATDLISALGYQSKSAPCYIMKKLNITYTSRVVWFDTVKRGVAKANCITKNSAMQILDEKCHTPEFVKWIKEVVFEDEPMVQAAQAMRGEISGLLGKMNVPQEAHQFIIARTIEKIIVDLLELRNQVAN